MFQFQVLPAGLRWRNIGWAMTLFNGPPMLSLKSHYIHNQFHMDQLQPCLENDEILFLGQEVRFLYDYGVLEDKEWYIDVIVGHAWQGRKIWFNVQWLLGEMTWKP